MGIKTLFNFVQFHFLHQWVITIPVSCRRCCKPAWTCCSSSGKHWRPNWKRNGWFQFFTFHFSVIFIFVRKFWLVGELNSKNQCCCLPLGWFHFCRASLPLEWQKWKHSALQWGIVLKGKEKFSLILQWIFKRVIVAILVLDGC